MTPVLAIALKDLRQRLRDRSALVLGFLAPVVIAAVMTFAFGGAQNFHLTAAVVDADHGELAEAFTAMLADDQLADLLTTVPVDDPATARSKVDAGEVAVAFVVPAGFTEAAHGGGAVPVTVVGSAANPMAAQVATSITEAFVARFNAVRLAAATAVAGGVPAEELSELAAATARRALPEQITDESAQTRRLNAVSYFGPAMGVFFAMFAIGFTARGFFLERANGTLDRISAAPVSPWVVLAGKSLATFAYVVASLTTMAVVTSVAFDAYWGPPLTTVALIVAIALAMVGLTALVIALARSERQAEGLASMVSFALVLLGGNFVFIATAPPALRTLALFTPNGWLLRAVTDLGTGAPTSAVVVPLLAILGFAVVTAAVAVLAIGRRRLR